MLNWLGKSASRRNKPDHISIEPIFDRDPPLYFLYPHAKLAGSSAPKFTRISGKFLVILKQPEHFLAIFAQLTSTCMLKVGSNVLDKDCLAPLPCEVSFTPGELSPGEYELPFCFEVPCDYWGRSAIIDPDGRDDERMFGLLYTLDLHVTRRIKDKQTETIVVQFPTKKTIQSMMWDVPGWRKLYHGRFFSLVSSPVDPGEMVPPLERTIEEFAPQLGPINLIITSRSFSIGALVNFSISLAAVPAGSSLLEIRGYLQAQFSWVSFKPDGPRWSDIPNKYPLFALQSSSIEHDTVSGALSAFTSARLPNDRIIGGTTLKHVRVPLKLSHQLIVEFEVVDENGSRKIISIRENVQVASCLLISESVNLPTYGSTPLSKEEFQPNRIDGRFACACGFSFEQLMDREYEGIEVEQTYEPPDIKPPELRASSSSVDT